MDIGRREMEHLYEQITFGDPQLEVVKYLHSKSKLLKSRLSIETEIRSFGYRFFKSCLTTFGSKSAHGGFLNLTNSLAT